MAHVLDAGGVMSAALREVINADDPRILTNPRCAPSISDEEPPSKRPSWKHQRSIFWQAVNRNAIYLAMWMRTGKTKLSIDIVDYRGHKLVLVVCPSTVVGVWPAQFALNAMSKWTVLPLRDGMPLPKRLAKAKLAIEKAGATGEKLAIIINQEAVWRGDFGKYIASLKWDAIIHDEAARGKKFDGRLALFLAAMEKKATQRLALSGTPLPHSPLDAWAQYAFLDKSVFGYSYWSFKNRYAVHAPQLVDRKFFTAFSTPARPDLVQCDSNRFDKFKDRGKVLKIGEDRYKVIAVPTNDSLWITPRPPRALTGVPAELGREINAVIGFQNIEEFNEKFYRLAFRVGEEVLDLPPDIEMERTFELSASSKKLYTKLESQLFAEINEKKVSVGNALVRLTRLQQVTSGFVGTDEKEIETVGAEKEAALYDVLADITEPVVVVCRFRYDLDAVERVAKRLERRYGEISGRRHDLTEDSKMPPDVDIEAVQIQAGGMGIDLSRAPFVIYYSIGTNLGDFEQVRMRSKGSSQTKSVTHIALRAENTVDGSIYLALVERKDVIEAVLAPREST